MEGSRSPSLSRRKRPRSFGETTDISAYPHRGAGWCAATAPLAPRRASRPPPDRTRYASQCDDVRYATSLGGIKALLTEPPFSSPPPPPPLSPGQQRGQPAVLRDSLPEPGACPEGCAAQRPHRTDFADRGVRTPLRRRAPRGTRRERARSAAWAPGTTLRAKAPTTASRSATHASKEKSSTARSDSPSVNSSTRARRWGTRCLGRGSMSSHYGWFCGWRSTYFVSSRG